METPKQELYVIPGEHVDNEASIKVMSRWVKGDVADESEIAVRVRVKAVQHDRVVVTIERHDESAAGVSVLLP